MKREKINLEVDKIVQCDKFEQQPFVRVDACKKCEYFKGTRVIVPNSPENPEIIQIICAMPRYKNPSFFVDKIDGKKEVKCQP